MGESTSDTATLLRENPPLSEKSHSGGQVIIDAEAATAHMHMH